MQMCLFIPGQSPSNMAHRYLRDQVAIVSQLCTNPPINTAAVNNTAAVRTALNTSERSAGRQQKHAALMFPPEGRTGPKLKPLTGLS